MTCYCGYNFWSVDCGCFIRRSISALKLSAWKFCGLNTYHISSTSVYFWTFSILCTFSVCDCRHIMTAGHLVETSRSISEGHKILNWKQAEILQRLWWDWLLFFWSAMCLITLSGPISFAPKKWALVMEELSILFLIRIINYSTRT